MKKINLLYLILMCFIISHKIHAQSANAVKTGLIPAGQTVCVYQDSIRSETVFEIQNTGSAKLRFNLSETHGDTGNSNMQTITLTGGERKIVHVTEFDYTEVKQHLNITNLSTEFTGGYVLATPPYGIFEPCKKTTPDISNRSSGSNAGVVPITLSQETNSSWEYKPYIIYPCPIETKVGIGTYAPRSILDVARGHITVSNPGNRWTNANWGRALETPMGYVWKTTNSNSINGNYLGFGITNTGWYWAASPGNDNSNNIFYPMHLGFDAANNYYLNLCGDILAKKVKVQTGWCDYVFEKNYKLLSLMELKTYIEKNKHLPNIPSAKEVEEKGIDVGEMQRLQMEKIEETYLHLVNLYEDIAGFKKDHAELRNENTELKKRIKALESK